ncbi:hypothetical protein IFM89_031229 [Coptis chinensis]|uniref:Uncharacterized protein n=1 Tax=Coptis chinensis TaxID=261450 RepID=A0A835IQU4_9MAGN|nr:hypothetical protein IFM89_031229 [Coptis chinensis]
MASASACEVTNHQCEVDDKHTESFLVRWIKETASDNKMNICMVAIEEGCKHFRPDGVFMVETEALQCALQCMYLCTLADRWDTMASILSKLPKVKDAGSRAESLEKQIKAAEGHVQAGRVFVILLGSNTNELLLRGSFRSEVCKANSSSNSFKIWPSAPCKNVTAEADIVDMLTIKLPNLGVTLLPMQFRQIRDPMEIINMVIASQAGVYFIVDELIDIGKVLGLSSPDDIAAVQEAVAREAVHLAFNQCLVLAKKGHRPIWDLFAAIARGPVLDNVDISSRKQLLSFALIHCDEESIGELLRAWKDLDIQSQCESLAMLTGTNPPNFSAQGSFIISLPSIVNNTDSLNMICLPYGALPMQWLDAVEAKLKQGNPDGSEDHELFTLLFVLRCNETQLSRFKWQGTKCIKSDEDKFFILFRAVLFPCFVSELVNAKQPLLAGFMVSRFMHTNPSLGLFNVVEASLKRYLEGQIQIQQDPETALEKIGTCKYLEYTVNSLRGKLKGLMLSALALLSENVR